MGFLVVGTMPCGNNNKLQPSAVISPKLPEKLEKLFEKIGAAIPKQP